MTKPQASRGEVWRGVRKKMKNEAHIGGLLGVCKVNMRGGGKRGSNLKILNKNRSTYFFLKKIMSNS